MIQTKERYVVDEQGNRQAVLLSIKDNQRLLEELEELETLRAYDAAAAAHDEAIPFEQGTAEVEHSRC